MHPQIGNGSVAQLNRASDYGSEGCGFESRRNHLQKEINSQDTENVDPITQRWWDMMADIMEVNADNSPVTIPLPELFHLD